MSRRTTSEVRVRGRARTMLCAFLVLTGVFGGVFAAGPASGLDFGQDAARQAGKTAGRMIAKILHREQAPPPSRPGAPGGPAPSRPFDGNPGTASGPGAAADTAGAAMIEEIALSPEPYQYDAIGRRDPFVSLVDEDGSRGGDNSAPDEYFVRGILWAENDRFALVESSEGASYLLREGDRLGPGTVTRIEPDAIVVYTSEFGIGRTTRLPLADWKGSKHARGER